jgi:carboxyl-terminal processing protease
MIRKLLPPLALVGALALVPVVTASHCSPRPTRDTYKELETFMSVFERVRPIMSTRSTTTR